MGEGLGELGLGREVAWAWGVMWLGMRGRVVERKKGKERGGQGWGWMDRSGGKVMREVVGEGKE